MAQINLTNIEYSLFPGNANFNEESRQISEQNISKIGSQTTTQNYFVKSYNKDNNGDKTFELMLFGRALKFTIPNDSGLLDDSPLYIAATISDNNSLSSVVISDVKSSNDFYMIFDGKSIPETAKYIIPANQLQGIIDLGELSKI